MNYNFKDLTGKRFGKLVVVKQVASGKNYVTKWLCECDCGNEKIISTSSLNSGKTKSCGCLQKQIARENQLKHGDSHSRLYKIWIGIKKRCNNPKCRNYSNYGGRGIKICEEWNTSFKCFKQWALDNGYKDNLSIDRIDVNGDYNPNNCKFSNEIEQANNRRTNRIIEFNGQKHTIAEWARIVNIKSGTLSARIDKYGWSISNALTTPTR